MTKEKKQVLIIVGPTASKKSELGSHLAELYGGEIINADAMQIYKEIPIITNSPNNKKLDISHHLYNFLSIKEHFSPIKYTNLATNVIREVINRDNLPIIIGGSGLYINSLVKGYNFIPPISYEVKQQIEKLYEQKSLKEIWDYLCSLDQEAKLILGKNDKQRIMRALEVIVQTGKSIFEFIKQPNFIPLPEVEYKIIFLHPDRELLHSMINERTIKLLKEGAIEEVISVKEVLEDKNLLANKALGVREILDYLNNLISREELVNRISISTRQYAKRQITWFKNQIKNKYKLEYSSEKEFKLLKNKIVININ